MFAAVTSEYNDEFCKSLQYASLETLTCHMQGHSSSIIRTLAAGILIKRATNCGWNYNEAFPNIHHIDQAFSYLKYIESLAINLIRMPNGYTYNPSVFHLYCCLYGNTFHYYNGERENHNRGEENDSVTTCQESTYKNVSLASNGWGSESIRST